MCNKHLHLALGKFPLTCGYFCVRTSPHAQALSEISRQAGHVCQRESPDHETGYFVLREYLRVKCVRSSMSHSYLRTRVVRRDLRLIVIVLIREDLEVKAFADEITKEVTHLFKDVECWSF